MMKKIILFLTIILSYQLSAQDTLLLRDDRTFLVVIKEIRSDEIKFKRFDFQDGPVYIISKDSIKEIHFFSGLKETFSIKVPKTIIDTSSQHPVVRGESAERIDLENGRYHYKGKLFKYHEISDVALNKCNNKELKRLMNEKKNTQIAYGVTFIGVPITIIGAGTIVLGVVDEMLGGGTDLLQTGLLITTGGVVTLSLNTYCLLRTKYLNKKIVKVYNESF